MSVVKRRMAGVLLAAVCMIATAGMAFADRVGSQQGPQSDMTAQRDAVNSPYYYYDSSSLTVVPVYCFYSSFMKDHMWTASEYEKEILEEGYLSGAETYRLQGIAGYVEETPSNRNIPVYRFWNRKTTDHFYTTSEAEKDQLARDLASGKDDYEYEGIAWYVPVAYETPVYRFFDTAAFNHFYTCDEQQMNSLSQAYLNGTGTYRYEGIAWYWYE
ncbi:MAG: hypothetical protein J6S83_10355 [Lachnospiraceae bacterium]|nr:hypothetical protein [Lachnospiraceae bacterium]